MHTHKLYPQIYRFTHLFIIWFVVLSPHLVSTQPISFEASGLIGESLINPTSLQFGPDDRLYVGQQDGFIKVYSIERQAQNQYVVVATEIIDLIRKFIPNHNDDGTVNPFEQRQLTGILVVGTATNPVLYVSSSDWRIAVENDSNLDTNSGIISRLTWIGNGINDPSGYWDKVDIVRGLPRSEENHSSHGLQLDAATNTLYLAQGGNTNKGSPSNSFSQLSEYALSAALLSIDLTAIEAMPIQGSGNTQYIYDLPTLDDPTRGIPGQADPGDPFGGNDGLNQARIVPGSPVQVYAPGFRNAYDVVLTTLGRLYTFDNGPNTTWGGNSLNCDNQTSEANSTGYGDQLHFVSGPGYYGGHPNYTRADPQNSGLYIYEKIAGVWTETATYDWMTDFPDPPVAVSMANPIECNLIPPQQGNALAVINASTNGITEYTASNFNNALKGDLLAASFSGSIYRFKLNAAGDQVTTQESLFSGFGSQPLDVSTQGDNDVFPGTVWAVTYGSNSITVFEPADFVICSGQYSLVLDDDNDGYSNADELDNNTDPCSAASQPADNDGDFVSDLNDADDDNDGIPDLIDAFAIDAANGLNTHMPIVYEFFADHPATGFFGLGFTGLMYNGTSDYLTQFNADSLAAGGTSGLFTVERVAEGDAFQATNSQRYAFQFGLNVSSDNGPFSVKVRMIGPFLGSSPGNYLSQGIYIGTGNQDDYLKFVVTAQSGGGLEVLQESNGIANSTITTVASIYTANYVDLYIDIDPTVGTYVTRYAINDGGLITLGGGVLSSQIAQVVQAANQALAIGLISTSTGPAAPFSATWDRIEISGDGPTKTSIADVEVIVGSPDDQINLDNYFEDDGGDAALSYTLVGNTSQNIGASINNNLLTLSYPAQPDSGEISIRATDEDGFYIEESFKVFVRAAAVVLYRVNAAGNLLAAIDGGMDWSPDTVNNVSPYHNGLSNVNGFGITSFDASVPPSTPQAVFKSERWDPAAAPEMEWDFPAAIPGIYEIRLYFANGYGGTSMIGQRVFSVFIENSSVLSSYDIVADVGHLTGVCKTFLVEVNDGNLDIDFTHEIENPLINAIEILGPAANNANLAASPNPLHFFSQEANTTSVPQPLSLQNPSNQTITVTDVSISGADAAMFASTYGGSFSIQAGASQNVNFTFTPTSVGLKSAIITITHDGDNSPVMINLTGEGITGGQQVLFRVNGGGPLTTAADASNPDWSKDDATGTSPYVTGVTNIFSTSDSISLHPTVPPAAPMSLFQTERWDPATAPDMEWDFPVAAGTPVEIRLYFAEIFLTQANNDQSGPRIFDIAIDGNVPTIFDDLDIFAEVGHDVGIMKAYQTTSDGNIDIDFLHVSQSPAIKGLEIIDLSTPTENQSPTLLSIDDQTNDEMEMITLQVVATDPEGDTLNYNASGLPPGLSIDMTSGLISGNVDESAALNSPYSVIVFVDDNVNPAVSDTFNWVINAPGLPTEICINTGGLEYTDGDGKVFMADDFFSGPTGFFSTGQAIDNTLDDVLFQSERYGMDFNYNIPLADGAYLIDLYFAEIYHGVNNTNGVDARVFNVDIEGLNVLSDYDIFATADAANGSPVGNGELYALQETFQMTVSGGTLDIRFYKGITGADNAKISAICVRPADPNDPPIVQNPGDQQNIEGDMVSLAIGATDSEGDTLTFGALGLPPGLSIHTSTGLISGTIPLGSAANSPYTVTISVNDGYNPEVTINFDWVILPNQPPVVDNPGDQQNIEGDAVGLMIVATDAEGESLSFVALGLPPALTINPTTGQISGTIDIGTAVNSPYQVSVEVSDGINPAVMINFDWTVVIPNQPPVVDNPGDQQNIEGDVINLIIIATDQDGDLLSYSENNLPPGLSISALNGQISGTIANGAATNSPYQVSISVSDGINPDETINFLWYVLPPPVPSAMLTINAGGGIDASTYGNNSLMISNTSTGGLKITALILDLRSALLPDLVFDPVGAAGDVTGKCFTANDGTVAVGVVIPTDICTDPFSSPHDGGYDVMKIAFDDFDPNEAFGFSVDIDPTSIQGATGTGVAGSISGLELSGSSIWAVFENGDTLKAQPYYDGSEGGSKACFDTSTADAPVIEVLNLPPPALPRKSVVNQAAQTIRLYGPIGAEVGLLVAEAGLYLSEVNGNGFDIDPFEGNQVLTLQEYSATIGVNGYVDIQITLTDADHAEWETGFNYLMAVVKEGNGCVSYTSDIWVLKYEEIINTPPMVDAIPDQNSAEWQTIGLQVNASDADGDLLIYTQTNLPPGLGINPLSGEITGTIASGAADNSPYPVTIRVEDGINPFVEISFLWNVTVIPCTGPTVNAIILVNADANTDMYALANNDVINLADLTNSISAHATVCGPTPDSVALYLSGDTIHHKREEFAPYALFGDLSGNYFPWPASPGTYTITAIPYITLNGQAVAGESLSVTITIIDEPDENLPPILPIYSNQQHVEWENVALILSASDPEGDPLSFSALNLPPGLNINPLSGQITGTVAPGASNNSPYLVSVGVSDGINPEVQATFYWYIGVQPCLGPEVTGFNLINADANSFMSALVDGAIISLADLTNNITVEATLCGFTADSVVLILSGDTLHKKTEEFAPYALFGDVQGNFWPWPATAGNYTITAIPYATFNGQVVAATQMSINVTLTDNQPPTIQAIPNQYDNEWENVLLSVNASDPEGDLLGYRAASLPPGLSINALTGQITGTVEPGAATQSPYSVMIGVSDGYNPTVITTFNWYIGTQPCLGPEVIGFTLVNADANSNMYPLANNDTINLADLTNNISVIAEVCGPQADSIVMSLTGDTLHTKAEEFAPYALFGDNQGNFWPWPATPGEYFITATPYTVINGGIVNGTALTIRVIVVDEQDNQPPIITPIVDQTSLEGELISLAIEATDPNNDVLRYAAMGLPPGLSTNLWTGEITGTIEIGAAMNSPYQVTVYAYDGEFLVSQTFQWFVEIGVCLVPEVQSFYLVNSDLNTDMYELTDGDTIKLNELTNGINIRADLCGMAIPDSVVLTIVEDTLHKQTEEFAPYALYGDLQGDYYTWPATPGNYTLSAVPYVGGVASGSPLSIDFVVTGGKVCIGDVLFVVGNINLNVGDKAAKARLEQLGLQVKVMHANQAQAAHANGMSLVMISATVFSVQVGAKFSDVAVPVMTWEAYIYDDLGFTGLQVGTDYQFFSFETSIQIQDSTHPIAGGISGIPQVTTVAGGMAWGRPAPSAAIIGTFVNDPSIALLFSYETGDQMFGRVAPARRVGFFSQNVTTASLNAIGWQLFDQSVFWAIGCDDQNSNLPPSVQITSPIDGTSYSTLENISITAEAFDPDGSLAAVEFYANGDFIDIALTYPYTADWTIPSYGTHTLQAIAIDEYGERDTSAVNISVEQPQACQGDVLFIVNNGPLAAGDLVVQQRLEGMGFSVLVKSDNGAQAIHANGKVLVMISSSVDSWEVYTKFTNVQVPLISYEAFLYDDLGMTGPTEAVDYYWAFDQTYVSINDPLHPMAGGYTAFVPVLSSPETFVWGQVGPAAYSVASVVGQPGQSLLFGYEAGDPMVGMLAPARRVGLFMQKSAALLMTAAGWNLFDQAVFWAIGGPCIPNTPVQPAGRQGRVDESLGKDFVLNTELYPNPTAENVSLKIDHPATGEVEIWVSDMLGKIHHRMKVEKGQSQIEVKLPIQDLAGGTYLIQIQHPAFRGTERLLKLRGR